MPTYTAADEDRHPAVPGDLWNESYYFNFVDAERGVGGYFRVGFRENAGETNVWCHLMRDGKPIYHRFRLNLPYSDTGLDGLAVDGISCELLVPTKTVRMRFDDRHLSVDLVWDGYAEVFEAHAGKDDAGLPTVLGSGHLLQSSEVTGTIRLGEEQIDVAGFGFRDHSWGIRDWQGVSQWVTATGQFGRDRAFVLGRMQNLNRDRSDSFGYLYDGKETLDLVDVSPEIGFHADGVLPTGGRIAVTDERGGRTEIGFEVLSSSTFPYDFNTCWECYARFSIGDDVGYGIFETNRRLSVVG